ncbi:S24 family peptidase [Vibrio gazogenes]|uniref:Peptidase S24-like n=1 Tax=Vibrio gazogenes DSM 21264 = NBRC 103151 TaxID=1123492 RepID=A0A1M5AL90_VIBGA|nr:S24 family peptidase [Vibrio gazogenes]USP12630.1 S24 family peptidase [Vibrio gazogenes]SHF30993.1 Peptidase S24-like [Vibrio gazogenes DSM 21264] [Vibrio gazogenes DSM 21264 = NBRC 103151]SJN55775.1 LexA repressor [Vibrio gazogenes]
MTNHNVLTFAQRLNTICDEQGIPVRGRARYLQENLPYRLSLTGIRKWLIGEAIPETSKLINIAELLGTTVECLLGSRDTLAIKKPEMSYQSSSVITANTTPDKSIQNFKPLAKHQSRVLPLLTPEQVLEQSNAPLPTRSVTKWITVSDDISAQAFAMQVHGNSMCNPNGFPSIPEGSIVIVEPNHEMQHGKIIVVVDHHSHDYVSVKKLEIDGPHQLLVSLNAIYRPLEFDTDRFRIIGHVKQIMMTL